MAQSLNSEDSKRRRQNERFNTILSMVNASVRLTNSTSLVSRQYRTLDLVVTYSIFVSSRSSKEMTEWWRSLSRSERSRIIVPFVQLQMVDKPWKCDWHNITEQELQNLFKLVTENRSKKIKNERKNSTTDR